MTEEEKIELCKSINKKIESIEEIDNFLINLIEYLLKNV